MRRRKRKKKKTRRHTHYVNMVGGFCAASRLQYIGGMYILPGEEEGIRKRTNEKEEGARYLLKVFAPPGLNLRLFQAPAHK